MNKMFFPVITELNSKLPYFFSGVGCFYEQEHVKRPNGRAETEWSYPYYQWIQCRSGNGEVILENTTYMVKEGQGIFLFPNVQHEYYAISESWKVDWVIFSGKHLEEFIQTIVGVQESGVYCVTAPHLLADKIAELYNTAQLNNPLKYLTCSGIVYEILIDLYRLVFKYQNASIMDKLDKLKPILQYIEKHFMEPITLSELSDLIHVTPQYLCSVFKQFTSHTVFEYINITRIQKSKELLLSEREIQIKEVAINSGFHDVSYFCSVFKRFENMSPKEFRNQG